MDQMDQPDINMLRHFNTLKDLGTSELEYIADNVSIQNAPKGKHLLDLGSSDPISLFLIEGRLLLWSADGKKQILKHTDHTAKSPLARLRPSRYRITADSQVRYLSIENSLLNGSVIDDSRPDRISVIEEDGTDGQTHNLIGNLLFQIYQDASSNHLSLKSLPEIARHISEIVIKNPDNTKRIGRALLLDPALAIKTLKAAKQKTGRTFTNCTQAVEALGPDETEQIVVGSTMREVFRSDSKLLQSERRRAWKQAAHVGAFCGALANRSERFDPELASIIGLLHNIGELVILDYARAIPQLQDDPDALKECLSSASEIRRGAFTSCTLSDEITSAVAETGHWHRESNSMGDYADILIVAQLHMTKAKAPDSITIPNPEQISAFDRLDLNTQALESAFKVADNLVRKLEASHGL